MEVLLEITPCLEDRNRDVIDVSKLVLEWVAGCPIEEGCHCEVQFAFKITLLIVLLHFDSHPSEVQGWRFGWGCMVRAIHDHIHNQLLVLICVLGELLRSYTTFESH